MPHKMRGIYCPNTYEITQELHTVLLASVENQNIQHSLENNFVQLLHSSQTTSICIGALSINMAEPCLHAQLAASNKTL